METINIKVTSATGSSFQFGELYLVSGVIKYQNGDISHVVSEISSGKKVEEVFLGKAVEPEPVPLFIESTPTVRSEKHKKKK
jgi:hypothetical protein